MTRRDRGGVSDSADGARSAVGGGVSAPGGQAVGVNYGQVEQHFYGRRPGYALAPFPVAPPAPPGSAWEAPSRLLSARYRLVAFAGRVAERAALAGWREGGAGSAVRLVHGPGGQGKTRLAAQFAAESAAAGWAVWAAGQETGLGPAAGRGVLPDGRGVLVVVDYAERWPPGDLFALLGDGRLPAGVPVRVLLLARPAGGWWRSLAHRLEDQDFAASVQPLGPVEESAAARAGLFAAAAGRFAELLGVADAAGLRPPDRIGDDAAFRLVLTVHMAALAAVDAVRSGRPVPADPAGLSGHRQRLRLTTEVNRLALYPVRCSRDARAGRNGAEKREGAPPPRQRRMRGPPQATGMRV